jgi:2-dehydropantoate 2-reductase
VKICIYGAGAIGGLLGVKLALAGVDVSMVARGVHLAQMQASGVTLISGGETSVCHIPCVADPAELGIQDYIIIALKAHSVPSVIDNIMPLCGPETAIVSAVNGIPWWYFHRLGGDIGERAIECVDPGARQWKVFTPERALGCIVYPACEIREPGVVEHLQGDRFSLGEPSGEKTDRVARLAGALRDAGFKAPVKTRIRDEVWIKLWGNVAFNPISALTGATLVTLCEDPQTRALARKMMLEAQAIGEALGAKFSIDIDQRIDAAAAVGAHKTSMLQDLENGRRMEIDALVTSVQELGQLVNVPTPTIDIVIGLVTARARESGCA